MMEKILTLVPNDWISDIRKTDEFIKFIEYMYSSNIERNNFKETGFFIPSSFEVEGFIHSSLTPLGKNFGSGAGQTLLTIGLL